MAEEFYTGNWEALAKMKKAMQKITEKYEGSWSSRIVEEELPETMEYKGVIFTADEIKKAVEMHYKEPILSVGLIDDFRVMFSSINHSVGMCTLDILVIELHAIKPEKLVFTSVRDQYVA